MLHSSIAETTKAETTKNERSRRAVRNRFQRPRPPYAGLDLETARPPTRVVLFGANPAAGSRLGSPPDPPRRLFIGEAENHLLGG